MRGGILLFNPKNLVRIVQERLNYLQFCDYEEGKELIHTSEAGSADARLNSAHDRAGEHLSVTLAVIPCPELSHVHCASVSMEKLIGQWCFFLLKN